MVIMKAHYTKVYIIYRKKCNKKIYPLVLLLWMSLWMYKDFTHLLLSLDIHLMSISSIATIMSFVNCLFHKCINSLLRRLSKTVQPLVRTDRPKPPSKLTVREPFVYRDHILLLQLPASSNCWSKLYVGHRKMCCGYLVKKNSFAN